MKSHRFSEVTTGEKWCWGSLHGQLSWTAWRSSHHCLRTEQRAALRDARVMVGALAGRRGVGPDRGSLGGTVNSIPATCSIAACVPCANGNPTHSSRLEASGTDSAPAHRSQRPHGPPDAEPGGERATHAHGPSLPHGLTPSGVACVRVEREDGRARVPRTAPHHGRMGCADCGGARRARGRRADGQGAARVSVVRAKLTPRYRVLQ